MTSIKKTVAIICAFAVMAVAVIVPSSAFTGSTLTLPSEMTLIDDFEGDLTTVGWAQSGTTATFEKSTDYGYGESGNSLKVTFTTGWPGVKTSPSGRNWLVTDDGIAFWLYAPAALTGGKTFYPKVTLKAPNSTGYAIYEKAISTNNISKGENIILIPWEDFVITNKSTDTTINFDTVGAYIYQFELVANFTTENTVYIDNVGIYRDDSAPVEFIPSTLTMPQNYLSLDSFDTASAWNWQATNKATLEYSEERGYGTEGRSAHVTWNETGWSGMKTTLSNINLQLQGDGITFWAYNMTGDLANFAVVLTQGGVKHEANITLTLGEAVYTIPFTDFVNKSGVAIVPTGTVSQIEFTKNITTANYYIDELGFYNEDGTCVGEHAYENEFDTDCNACGEIREPERYASTVAIPQNYYSVESFDGENSLGWEAHDATLDFAKKRAYGTTGKSAHVVWDTSAWGGFKTKDGLDINLAPKGDGFTFWAYNVGSRLNNFTIVLTQDGTSYEEKITLKAGEAVYNISWSKFVNGQNSIDITKNIEQINFTKSSDSAEYYIDAIGFYKAGSSCIVHSDANEDGVCDVCGHKHVYSDWIVEIEATKTTEGLKVQTCTCGDRIEKVIPVELKFKSAALELQSALSIIYYVDKSFFEEFGYTNPYVVFTINGVTTTITEYTVRESDGAYEFKCAGIAPRLMNEIVTAVLYAEYNGEVYSFTHNTYSVVQYCKNQIGKTTSDTFRTFLADTLYYGSKAQIFGNHKTDALAFDELTDAQKAYASASDVEVEDKRDLEYVVKENAQAAFKSATLYLQDSIIVRYAFELNKDVSIDDVQFNISVPSANYSAMITGAENFTYNANNGRYTVDFAKLTPRHTKELIYTTVCDKNGKAISNTICYSIETYAARTLASASTSENLAELVKAIMKFGNSAEAYSRNVRKITATYEWHPGLPNEDVYYDLTVMVDGKPANAGSYTIISDVDGVTAEQNRVTLKYSAREKGDDVIVSVMHESGASCDISIPCYKWTQTFNDDFNGTELDRTKWGEGSTLTTVAPDDADTYTVIDRAKAAKDCFTVSDGKLNMLIKAEPTYDTTNKIKYLYSECTLNTANKFEQTFGLFQARIASAKFSGINTAFWLLPKGSYSKYYTNFLAEDPRYGLSEIDIIESSVAFGNYDRRTFAISEHFYDYTNNYEAGNKRAAYYKVDGSLTDFHTYSCVWTPTALYYYVDNQLIRISDGLQTESVDGREISPAYMIVDVALYLDNAWVGKRDFTAADLPIAGYVDWVRAYQFN